MSDELLQAKVRVIESFARGPGILIEDDSTRENRIVSLLALVDLEFDTAPASITALSSRRVVSLKGDDVQARNALINWDALVEELRKNPGTSKTLEYEKMSTAAATASRQRNRYKDLEILTERRGEKGLVILTYRGRKG